MSTFYFVIGSRFKLYKCLSFPSSFDIHNETALNSVANKVAGIYVYTTA